MLTYICRVLLDQEAFLQNKSMCEAAGAARWPCAVSLRMRANAKSRDARRGTPSTRSGGDYRTHPVQRRVYTHADHAQRPSERGQQSAGRGLDQKGGRRRVYSFITQVPVRLFSTSLAFSLWVFKTMLAAACVRERVCVCTCTKTSRPEERRTSMGVP